MRRAAPALALALLAVHPAAAQDTTLRVLSFNIWGGGANEGKDIEETVAVLRAAEADLIGLQEASTEGPDCTAESCPPLGPSVGPALAAALGYHYHAQTAANPALWANAVLSRFPIAGVAPHDLGVAVALPDGRTAWLLNVHLDDEPYQPYQLFGIAYGPAPFVETAAEAVRYAEDTRGPAMDLLDEALAATAGAAAVLVTGDFNEPSALDWTEGAAQAGLHPLAVEWPTTRRLMARGFQDAYRAVHPDPVARPAFTWTPRTPEDAPDAHPDRIDFAFASEGLAVLDAWILGETGPRSDIALDPWPSDRRAVLAEMRF
jgi:exodeoxyribonuclease-3